MCSRLEQFLVRTRGQVMLLVISTLVFAVMVWRCDEEQVQWLLHGEVVTDEYSRRILAPVIKYNLIYSDFYASGGNPTLIDEFPGTKSVRHEIFRDLGFLRDNKRVLVYNNASASPIEIRRIGPGMVELLMSEAWNYSYQTADRKYALGKIRGMHSGFTYYLKQIHRTWVVTGWRHTAVNEILPDENLY